jgi:hypothetical protein
MSTSPPPWYTVEDGFALDALARERERESENLATTQDDDVDALLQRLEGVDDYNGSKLCSALDESTIYNSYSRNNGSVVVTERSILEYCDNELQYQ